MERHQYCKDENAVAAVRRELAEYMEHGGRVQMENGEYPLQEALIVDASSLCLCGDVWACNTDPNGVFETDHGTKLRMQGKTSSVSLLTEKLLRCVSSATKTVLPATPSCTVRTMPSGWRGTAMC